MPTQLEDSVHHTSWRLPRACMRPGAPILKTRYAIFSISSEPLVECCFRYSEGGCRVPYRLRLLEDTAHHQFSRIRGLSWRYHAGASGAPSEAVEVFEQPHSASEEPRCEQPPQKAQLAPVGYRELATADSMRSRSFQAAAKTASRSRVEKTPSLNSTWPSTTVTRTLSPRAA